jgi:hypothetical protein
LVDKLAEILRIIGSELPERILADWIQAIGVYVMTVNKNIDHEQYKQTLASILPTQFEPGSLADRLLIQGREEGREEGLVMGKIQMLQDLLGEKPTATSLLVNLSLDSLTAQLAELQQRLRDRPS